MREQERQHAIRLKLARMESGDHPRVRPAIPTGFGPLDRALGGGLPRSRIVEIFGPASSGKTTLLLQTIAHLQSENLAAAWIDADRSFDPAYATQLGVAVDRLPVAQPDTAEQALEIARQLVGSGAVDLLVVDSAAALVPSLELEAEIGQIAAGLHGRVLASGLRRLAASIGRSDAVAVLLNQSRLRPDMGAGEGETSAGGPALKLHAAVRIAMLGGSGRLIRLHVLKNKAAAGAQDGRLEWLRTGGFAKSP